MELLNCDCFSLLIILPSGCVDPMKIRYLKDIRNHPGEVGRSYTFDRGEVSNV